MPDRAENEQSHPKAWDVFAAAYADASNPLTFESGVESYLAAYPDVKRDSAKAAATRLLRQPRMQELIEACRQANRTAAGITAPEFIRRGWEVFNDLADGAVAGNPKLAAALPNLYMAIGKAAGFIIERSQSKVEITERQAPPTPEEIAAAEEAFARFRRLNQPNALPQATATALPHPQGADAVEADFEVVEATTNGESHQHHAAAGGDDAPLPGAEGEAVSELLVEREPLHDRPDGE